MENNIETKKVEKKSNSLITVIITIFVMLLIIVGAGGYLVYKEVKAVKNSIALTKSYLETQVDDLDKRVQAKLTAKSLEETKSEESPVKSCESTLSTEDKAAMKNWKTYTVSKYGYSFQYPSDWKITSEKEDIVTFEQTNDKISFQVRSGDLTDFGFEGYQVDSKKDIKIACVGANENFLSEDKTNNPNAKKRIIWSKFTHNKSNQLFMISYDYLGASISSDIVEAWDLILKSVK